MDFVQESIVAIIAPTGMNMRREPQHLLSLCRNAFKCHAELDGALHRCFHGLAGPGKAPLTGADHFVLQHGKLAAASKGGQVWTRLLPSRAVASTTQRFAASSTEGKAAAMFSMQRLRSLPLTNAMEVQLLSMWRRYRRVVYGLLGVGAIFILWRTTFRLASFFVDVTETLAEMGLLGLAVTVVVFGALYLRSYYTIEPTRVYRLAMQHLSNSPAVQEVMGTPLLAGDVRVTVLSGGGLAMKGLGLKHKSPRVQMMFKLDGADRQGLVSLEAKKKKGKYAFKLLSVDVQPTGPLQASASSSLEKPARIFVVGDLAYYERGSLLWDLRKPYLTALGMQSSYEQEDEREDAEAAKLRAAKAQLAAAQAQPQEPKEKQQPDKKAEAEKKAAPVPAAPQATAVAAQPSQTLWQRLWGPAKASA